MPTTESMKKALEWLCKRGLENVAEPGALATLLDRAIAEENEACARTVENADAPVPPDDSLKLIAGWIRKRVEERT